MALRTSLRPYKPFIHKLIFSPYGAQQHEICSWRDYKKVAGDLKRAYQSATEEEALHELDQLDEK